MKYLLLILLLTTSAHAFDGKRHARFLKAEFDQGGLTAIALRSDQAMDAMVARGIEKLRDVGKEDLADTAESDYAAHYHGYLTHMHLMRDIGDHAPLIKWLATFYDTLELALGVQVCKSLHLSDIKTLNFAIPVVFHPCDFPMDAVKISREAEYKNHFAKGGTYNGLIPVVSYWVIDLGCMAALAGSPLCGVAANAAEMLMANFIGPFLSDRIFEKQHCAAGGEKSLFLGKH